MCNMCSVTKMATLKSAQINSLFIINFSVLMQYKSIQNIDTVKLVYNNTLGPTKMCCYNQVVVVTRTFSTETIESVPTMCVVV